MDDTDSGWEYNFELRHSRRRVEGGVVILSVGQEICRGENYPVSYLSFFPNSYGLDLGLKMESISLSDCPGSVLRYPAGRPDSLLSLSQALITNAGSLPGWHRNGLERITQLLRREMEAEVANVDVTSRHSVPFLTPDEEESVDGFPIDLYEYRIGER